MTKSPPPLARRPAWKALAAHARKIRPQHLRTLFAADPKRGQRLTLEAAGLLLDYSKNRVTDQTMKLLVKLAKESGLRERTSAMFGGERINVTENRRPPRGAARPGRPRSW
jgi:glucose-6-phosphate isomerase